MSFAAAQHAYDNAEPAEGADVQLSAGATVRHLATLLDDHGITSLVICLRGGKRYVATATTRDAEGHGEHVDFATAIAWAMSAAVTEQREIDSAVGS
jgi:hypothetical protein